MKSAIVTGGAGFVGSNLVKMLHSTGYKVYVVERPNCNLNNLTEILNDIEIYEYTSDLNDMINYFANKNIDVVFHLASYIVGEHQISDVDVIVNSNILLGCHLLEMMKANEIKFMINTGSFWQYYEGKEYDPVNLYAASKKAFIDMMIYYHNAGHVNCLTLNLFDNYSENDARPKLINIIAERCVNGESIELTAGEQPINLTHVNDVCSAFIAGFEFLVDNSDKYQEFYIFSNNTMSVKELVNTYESVNDCKLNVEWGAKPYRFREVMVINDSYPTLPNWQPSIEIKEGLKLIGEKYCKLKQ